MKKLLSIFISVIMILGLMPQVFASVTPVAILATGETYIEAENYLTATMYSSASDTTGSTVAMTNQSDGTAHNGAYAKYYGSGEDKYKIAVDIPVTVSQAGKYLIEYRGQVWQNWLLTDSAIYVDGTKIVNTAKSINNADEMRTIQTVVDLSADSHTITIDGKNPPNGPVLSFRWDYIKVTPVSTVSVSSTGATRLEAENYGINQNESNVIYGATAEIKTDASLSGGKGLSTGRYQLSSSTTQPYTTIDFPVNITTEGYYNIKSNLEFIYDGTVCISDYSFLVDGTSITTYTNEASASWATRDTNVYLTTGNHTLTIKSMVVNRGFKHCSLGVDYMEIAPHSVDVSSSSETKIEAENYTHVTGVTNADPGETNSFVGNVSTNDEHGAYSGAGYLNLMKQSNTYKTITWELPVNIAQSGVYKIDARVIKSNTYWGTTKVYIDGTDFGTGTNGSNPPEFESQTYTTILSEGNHTIKVENTLNSMNAVVIVDYVEFEPVLSGLSDPDATATITPPAEVLSDNEVKLSYTYSGTNAEGSSIFRLMYKDGTEWKVYETKNVTAATATVENPAKITLPDALVGKEVAVQFIPVDSTGAYGPLSEWKSTDVLRRALTITSSLSKSGSNFVASVEIEVNKALSPTANFYIILAKYKVTDSVDTMLPYADGEMTNAMKTVSVQAIGNYQVDLTLAAGDATEARLYIWDGTGLNNAGTKIYENVKSTLDE